MKIGSGSFAFRGNFVDLGANRPCPWEHVFDALIFIVLPEVSKVGKSAAVVALDCLHHFFDPIALTGPPAMVFHDGIHSDWFEEVTELLQSVDGLFLHFFPVAARAAIDSDRVAAEIFRHFPPKREMSGGFLSLIGLGRVEGEVGPAENELVFQPEIVGPLLELGKKRFAIQLVFKESVEVFQRLDSGFLDRDGRVVEWIHFSGTDLPVKGILLEGNLEPGFGVFFGCQERKRETGGDSGSHEGSTISRGESGHSVNYSLSPKTARAKGRTGLVLRVEEWRHSLLAMAFSVEKAFELVAAAHERERLAHAFLVTGPKGSGKEELVARMGDLLNGEKDDEVDLWGEQVEKETPELSEQEGEFLRVVRPRSKSRRISVDEIRDLEKMMNQSSPSGTWKIGVIVDADRMGESAENAFLKTLEEPPRESLLLLLSSEPEKLLDTIWSRCVHLSLAPRTDGDRPEEVQRVLSMLEEVTGRGIGQMESGLAVKAGLEELLRERKAVIEKEHEQSFKEERAKYQKVVDTKWLDDREKTYLAQASADYLGERASMIETIQAWVGDLVRVKAGGKGLEFPEYREIMAAAVAEEDIEILLRRVTEIGELRRLLETNVVESLALEVLLLRTFGKIAS